MMYGSTAASSAPDQARTGDIDIRIVEDQYDDILRCCNELVEAVQRDGRGDVGLLSQYRLRLSGRIRENLTYEEQHLTGPLQRLTENLRPATYRDLSRETANLRLLYSEHVQSWTVRAMAADRRGYAAAVMALVSAVRLHIARKRECLPAWREALRSPAPGTTGYRA